MFTEQYFGGGGITLNERFSAPQAAAFDEDEEAAKLTLNQRFSANQCVQPFSHEPTNTPALLFTASFFMFSFLQRLQCKCELSA